MPLSAYRYQFNEPTSFLSVLALLDEAITNAESIHGTERVRLDARFAEDTARGVLVIDATTEVGQTLNQLFVGLARREFGDAAFTISRCRSDMPRHKGRRSGRRRLPRHLTARKG
ncbi:MAG: hypothetical protein KJZ69_17595 [Phycisphaerales bacterium]|nr:hypothetical protein [Phycisphaerales bacterium]